MIQKQLIRKFALILIISVCMTNLVGCDFFTGLLSKKETKDVEIENAYMEYRKALRSGDIEMLKRHISERKAHELEGDNAQAILAFIKALSPPRINVTGTYVKGDAATLTASAVVAGSSMEGIVHLLRENGKWKVYEEKWEVQFVMTDTPGHVPMQQEEELPPNVVRPSNFNELLGTWQGQDIRDGSEWVFTFSHGYNVRAEGPHDAWYSGKAAIHWDLGTGSDGSMKVPPGAGVLDIDISDASSGNHVGQTSLGAFAIYGSTMKLCAGEPGKTKRPTTFDDTGSFRCFEMTRISGEPEALVMQQDDVSYEREPVIAQPYDQPEQKSSGATGEAIIVKDGVKETYILKTGFFSETNFDDPKKAHIEFQVPSDEFSNARRIEITLDATEAGIHYADGKAINESMFDRKELNIGEQTPNGRTAIFRFLADGGQIFPPKDACVVNITSSYTGTKDGVFAGEIADCTVHSAGIDYNISSVIFIMRGVPAK
jgi:hypothetical protein